MPSGQLPCAVASMQHAAQAALKELLYGGKQRIDVQRLQRIADGFTSFTVDGLTADPVEACRPLRPVVITLKSPVLCQAGRFVSGRSETCFAGYTTSPGQGNTDIAQPGISNSSSARLVLTVKRDMLCRLDSPPRGPSRSTRTRRTCCAWCSRRAGRTSRSCWLTNWYDSFHTTPSVCMLRNEPFCPVAAALDTADLHCSLVLQIKQAVYRLVKAGTIAAAEWRQCS